MNNVSEGKEMKYSAILLLAGRSTRFNGEINKVYMTINQKKLFQYSLDVFNKDEKCEKIIVVYNEQDHKLLFENNDSFEKLAFTVEVPLFRMAPPLLVEETESTLVVNV